MCTLAMHKLVTKFFSSLEYVRHSVSFWASSELKDILWMIKYWLKNTLVLEKAPYGFWYSKSFEPSIVISFDLQSLQVNGLSLGGVQQHVLGQPHRASEPGREESVCDGIQQLAGNNAGQHSTALTDSMPRSNFWRLHSPLELKQFVHIINLDSSTGLAGCTKFGHSRVWLNKRLSDIKPSDCDNSLSSAHLKLTG